MYRRHGEKLGLVFLACDLAVTSAAWFAGYAVRFACWPSEFGVPDLGQVLAPLPMVLLFAAIAYKLSGLYEIHRLQQLPRELGVVCRAGLLLFGMAITFTFYRRELYDSRLALALFLVFNVCGLALARRIVWRSIAWLRKRGLNHGRALVIGQGRIGRLVYRTLRENHWTGLEPVGCVDGLPKVSSHEMQRLGELEELPKVVAEYDVDHVFIALPTSRYHELPRIYQLLSGLAVEVIVVPDVPGLAGMRIRMQEIDQVPFLSLRENPQYAGYRLAKRITDIAGALVALLLLSPLMLVIALWVKLSSPGPILFRQPRAGLGGRRFNMLKFRTMRVDAEAATGAVWATKNDDRCTPLGRYLRKWSLDELPQLFNVLCGDMSLVGPRPERPVFVEQFQQDLPAYAWRHQVKAGMTGWAQVNGWRGNTSLRRRLEHDLYYINHWSMWLDFQILGLTLWCGFRHKNAY